MECGQVCVICVRILMFCTTKLGVYNAGGNCFGGVKVKEWTDTADSTNVMIVGFGQCRDLIGKRKMFAKYEAKVASGLSNVC